jgi:hypothetical protein
MNFFEHRYYNTYYYSNILSNILSRDIELIGFISNFFSHEEAMYDLAKAFQKDSAFHHFIKSVVGDFFQNDMDEFDQEIFNRGKIYPGSKQQLYIEQTLKEYRFNDHFFNDFIVNKNTIAYSDIEAYRDDLILTGVFEELLDKIANEIFYIMFNNRQALLQFNYIVAEHMPVEINKIEEVSVRKLFTNKGYLKRVRVPDWCKHAVYFRDRGKCCFCSKDLSGVLNIHNGKQYDHIVPLAQGGLNDVSNIQLLCAGCNKKKSKFEIQTSHNYESWY